MIFLELINQVKTGSSARNFALLIAPDIEEYDQIQIYLISSLSMHSQVAFFDAEVVGDAVFEKDGVKYICLVTLDALQEMVEALFGSPAYTSDEAVAARILEYRIKDA